MKMKFLNNSILKSTIYFVIISQVTSRAIKRGEISMDGLCGAENDNKVCGEGKCCSKLGWCGSTHLHCNVEEGCQSEFGDCHHVDPIEIEEPVVLQQKILRMERPKIKKKYLMKVNVVKDSQNVVKVTVVVNGDGVVTPIFIVM